MLRGLICLAAVALSGCGGATHGVRLVYETGPTPTSPETTATRERAAATIRARLRGIVPGATVGIDPQHRISVFLPGVSPGAPLTLEIGATGVLEFYDWEANVIGPTGRPAPTDKTVTGGLSAGSAGSGITLYNAVIRASKRPAIHRSNGAGLGSGPDGVWYLVDKGARKVLGGPAPTKAALTGGHAAAGGSAAVHVEPGTVIVQAESPNDEPDPALDSYYVLNDAPSLGNADITDPREAPLPQPGGSPEPSVTFDFTRDGGRAFQAVTKVLARRGAARSVIGHTDLQHFAIVLDDRAISIPSIDFNQLPNGIDAGNSSQIGVFNVNAARMLAQILQTGPLPVGLTLVSARSSSA
jgi:hypothetical protein